MRRTHLRGHTNILKRLLIHTGAFHLGLILRQIVGVGKPRRLQGSGAALFSLLFTVAALVFGRFVARNAHSGPSRPAEFQLPRFMAAQVAA
jgi:transposase